VHRTIGRRHRFRAGGKALVAHGLSGKQLAERMVIADGSAERHAHSCRRPALTVPRT
jgi:hypothetical protein